MRARDGTLRIGTHRGKRHELAGWLVVTSVAIAFALGAFLLMRRASGAFSSPVPVPQLLATAIVATAWAIVIRELSSSSIAIVALLLIILLMLALACSYPGARIIDWLVWPTALVATALCPPLMQIAIRRPRKANSRPVDAEDESAAQTEKVVQQLTRVRLDDGHEAIRGLLVAEFASGERQVTLYTAFCPPFERLPQVEVNLADDSDATLKLVQLLHNGAQIDVRLSGPAPEATSVAVEFFATDADSI
jgi:hypothetical protein